MLRESECECRTDPGSEIARLTALLHAREMEYLRVSRELEEAKALLALVRARSAADLAQAKQVAVEKDLRLHTAEQALSSMKLVFSHVSTVSVAYCFCPYLWRSSWSKKTLFLWFSCIASTVQAALLGKSIFHLWVLLQSPIHLFV